MARKYKDDSPQNHLSYEVQETPTQEAAPTVEQPNPFVDPETSAPSSEHEQFFDLIHQGESEKKQYRLKVPHRRRGELLAVGTLISPTEKELQNFKDIFEPVE